MVAAAHPGFRRMPSEKARGFLSSSAPFRQEPLPLPRGAIPCDPLRAGAAFLTMLNPVCRTESRRTRCYSVENPDSLQ
jgi:hypothetical protein